MIAGGRVIDRFQGIDRIRDAAIDGARVAEVSENLPTGQPDRAIDESGMTVTPGDPELWQMAVEVAQDFTPIAPDEEQHLPENVPAGNRCSNWPPRKRT